MNLEWFDKYEGAKALNRSSRRWKCLIGFVVNGRGLTAIGIGDTPDEAVSNAVVKGKQLRKDRLLTDRLEAERIEREGKPEVAVRWDDDEEVPHNRVYDG